MPEEKTLSRKRTLMYLIGFVFNLSFAIPTYINSSFLAQFTTDALVGIIYAAGSLMTIACFVHMPTLLQRYGNFKVTMSLLTLEAASLVGLISSTGTLAVIFSFIANFVTIAIINFTLDVFLESFSSNANTGKIRGTFLTTVNSAWLIAPILAPLILIENMYQNIYMASFALLIPAIILIYSKLKNFKDPLYNKVPFWKSMGEIWSDKDIKYVLMSQLLLQFFYAWMVIYMPIYLHTVIGFDWTTIGIIFSFMLLPFVLLEAPLGRLADSRFGEKEMLSIGFVILAISTFSIPFITDHNILIWGAVLFMSRVGAAMVEVMADIFFFKKVDASKAHLISFSRMTRPLAYVVSPIVATVLFTVFDMKGLFIFLGLLMLYGLRYSLSLRDTN